MGKFSVLPRTALGKASAWLFMIFGLALLLRILQISDWIEIFAFFLEYLAGVSAWITGLIAVLKYKERSILIIAYLVLPVVMILYFESVGSNGFIRKLFS